MVAKKFGIRLVRASRISTRQVVPHRAPQIMPVPQTFVKQEAPSTQEGVELISNGGTDTLVLQTERDGIKSPWLQLKRVPSRKTERTAAAHNEVSFDEKISFQTDYHTPHSQTLSDFIKAIASGKTQEVLAMFRSQSAERKNIPEILISSLCELDKVYCRRLGEQEELKDESIEDAFEEWSNEDIQKLIHMLSAAIDQKHASPETSAKMALLRALEIAQGKKRITSQSANLYQTA
jgi:hypothetical protein